MPWICGEKFDGWPFLIALESRSSSYLLCPSLSHSRKRAKYYRRYFVLINMKERSMKHGISDVRGQKKREREFYRRHEQQQKKKAEKQAAETVTTRLNAGTKVSADLRTPQRKTGGLSD